MPRFSGELYTPAIDCPDNIRAVDVLGNKDDTHLGTSLIASGRRVDGYLHQYPKVYPTLADGVVVTADAAAWTLGSLVEIIPINTVTKDYSIHAVDFEDISANAAFELVLYMSSGDTEIGRVRFVQTSVMSALLNTWLNTAIIPANSRVRAALASNPGGRDVTLSVRYHEYD